MLSLWSLIAVGWAVPAPQLRTAVAVRTALCPAERTLAAARFAAPLRCGRAGAGPEMATQSGTQTAKEPIGVGIVGCGRIGIVHLDTLRKCPKARVVSIGGSSKEETVRDLAAK